VADLVKKLPQWLVEVIVKGGMDAALDVTYDITKKFQPAHFDEELKGMAMATGIDVKQYRRLAMFPELIKAACTIVGAHGNATSQTSTPGSLYQIRALDWDSSSPLRQWPLVTVYHPAAGQGHAFAVVGWVGLVGTIGTGYSSAGIGLSEKVWLTDDSVMSRIGTPWTYVLRDVLQYADDLSSAVSMLVNAKRTCAIHVGVGDRNTMDFRGIEYAAKIINIYDDKNQPAYPQHPQLNGVVYWDKHKQPTGDYCLGSLLQEYYGQLDIETYIHIVSMFQTGDMHIALYDFENEFMFVANAAAPGESGPHNAYDRQFVKFNMPALFAEQM
jgi:hypothetical protein